MGYLQRPFIIEERELNFREAGGITFSNRELGAYRMAITVDVISTTGTTYQNFKSLPPESFYGYATIFRGAACEKKIPINFPKNRVYDVINPEARDDETVSEIQTTSASGFAGVVGQVASLGVWAAIQALLGDAWGAVDWLFFGTEQETEFAYIRPPRLSPFPTEMRFRLERQAQIRVRVTTWHFETLSDFALDPATDPNDPTDGEDPYEEPAANDSSDPFAGNPFPTDFTEPGTTGDPRDFNNPGTTIRVLTTRRAYINSACEVSTLQRAYDIPNGVPPLTLFPPDSNPPVNITCPNPSFRSGWTIEDSDGNSIGPIDEGIAVFEVTIDGFDRIDPNN